VATMGPEIPVPCFFPTNSMEGLSVHSTRHYSLASNPCRRVVTDIAIVKARFRKGQVSHAHSVRMPGVCHERLVGSCDGRLFK
jgi:hypothetical protein